MILEILGAIAGAYQLFATVACLAFRNGQGPGSSGQVAGGSILKPVYGGDPALRAAIASHTVLEGEYELLCGVRAGDAAAELIAQFPTVKTVECTTVTPNGKVGSLIDLTRAARYPILIVNDADIRVPQDYLSHVIPQLGDPRVGLVTCLYRPEGDTLAARFEGLGVSTDFAPSTLVARMVGVDEFALGSTMAFRRTDLDRIGGFETIADYLADDYQLGHRIHALGLKCVLSDTVVTTRLSGGWADVWTSPGPLGADGSSVEILGIHGTSADVHDSVGDRGAARRTFLAGGRASRGSHADGHHSGMVRAEESGRIAAVAADSAPGFVWRSGMGGGVIRTNGNVEGPDIGARWRGPHPAGK